MANTKSAIKEIRVAERRRVRGKAYRSSAKTKILKAEKLIFSGDVEKGKEAALAAISTLDKAASKGIIHRNNAARRKARLIKKLNQASSAPKAEAKETKKKQQA